MRVVSLLQPAATLTVTREPLDAIVCGGCATYQHDVSYHEPALMVSRWVTFDYACPSDVVGTRIAIAATDDQPEAAQRIGGYIIDGWPAAGFPAVLGKMDDPDFRVPLPLGVVVGSAIVEASYPIVQFLSRGPGHRPSPSWTPYVEGVHPHPCVGLNSDASRLTLYRDGQALDIDDQLPFADWSPGRFAWPLTDPAPCQERCPRCWGHGWTDHENGIHSVRCSLCNSAGFCDPVRWVSSGGRLPEWDPT